jgi:hypothetical protein
MIKKLVCAITAVRSEYTSARLIYANLDHRVALKRYVRPPGHVPAEIDYETVDGERYTIAVRDYDVRFLDRVSLTDAIDHVNLIHQARHGNHVARERLRLATASLHHNMRHRFALAMPTESDHVIPYTTTRDLSPLQISNKGAMLLDLHRRGLATSDFILLASSAYSLPVEERERRVDEVIDNLEKLSGRKLEHRNNPLLIAMRCAMPEYVPGFMPTYLNVGLTPEMMPGLPTRYGEEGAARIRLSNRKTILEALDPTAFASISPLLRPGLSREEATSAAERIEAMIDAKAPQLLRSAREQVRFFLDSAYAYYAAHQDTLRNFMGDQVHYPTMIFQRMICSVLDESCYAGVLFSRHPRTGVGVLLQYGRAIYGEDLMTGRLVPEERTFFDPSEAREQFPAVYHFWRRLAQLEEKLRSPVMVEFTGVHGTFTLLQVNEAELSGLGMLTAVMDLHRAGKITAERARALIKGYHIRQIESDTIDPSSLLKLDPFARGFSVLPRSAVTGRLYLSSELAAKAKQDCQADNVILARDTFYPTDAIRMQQVDGICSLSPAAIHVVTAAQNLGIPSLLNLGDSGVTIDEAGRTMANGRGVVLHEGDWVTISSRKRTLFVGKASFQPARLLRFMACEEVDISDDERPAFERWASYYREHRLIVENVEASEFGSLKDLGQAVRYGRLKEDPDPAAFVNCSFDSNEELIVASLLETTLGTHLVNYSAYELLSADRKVRLLRAVLALCRERGVHGYKAGCFVLGSFVQPGLPLAFWKSFQPDEIALLMDEWLLHQKYLAVLGEVGERRVNRAREQILSQGLSAMRLDTHLASVFMPLKLGQVDLGEVRRSLPEGADPQCAELLDLLALPYREFYDFDSAWSVGQLESLCKAERLPLPAPDDR